MHYKIFQKTNNQAFKNLLKINKVLAIHKIFSTYLIKDEIYFQKVSILNFIRCFHEITQACYFTYKILNSLSFTNLKQQFLEKFGFTLQTKYMGLVQMCIVCFIPKHLRIDFALIITPEYQVGRCRFEHKQRDGQFLPVIADKSDNVPVLDEWPVPHTCTNTYWPIEIDKSQT